MVAASIPALATALLFGLLLVISPFSSRDLHAQEGTVPTGQMRLVSNDSGSIGDFILELQQMAAPPEGEHYELWMQSDSGELLRIGDFAVDQGRVTFTGSTEENLLAKYNSVLISLEPDDDADETAIANVTLSTTLPSQLLTLTRRLLTGSEAGDPAILQLLQSQTAIAVEENRLLAEALAVEDYDAVRRHAERIVNLLDGSNGAFFGDLDLDGEVENPGDDIGVHQHYVDAALLASDIFSVVSTTEGLNTQAQEIIVMLEDSQLLVEQARDQARKVFAADSKAESEAVVQETELLLSELTEKNANTLAAILELATYRFNPAAGGVGAAGGVEEGGRVRLGELRLAGNESSPTGDFILELQQMAAPPEGEHYELWMQSDAGELMRLGEFEVDEGNVTYEGSTEENLLRDYSTILISLEPDDDPNEEELTQVVLSSTLPSQLLTLTRQLLTGSEGADPAVFEDLQEQIAIAAEHSGLLADSLILENIPEVRRHAEHIVNILDGNTGDFFGDLDRDGQPQNPGDGVGVRVYLEQAHDLVDTLSELISEESGSHTHGNVPEIAESQLLVEQARERALDVFGLTEILDLLDVARDLVNTTTLLTESSQQRARHNLGPRRL